VLSPRRGETRLSETSRLSETPQPGRDAGRDRAAFWTFGCSRVICFDGNGCVMIDAYIMEYEIYVWHES